MRSFQPQVKYLKPKGNLYYILYNINIHQTTMWDLYL